MCQDLIAEELNLWFLCNDESVFICGLNQMSIVVVFGIILIVITFVLCPELSRYELIFSQYDDEFHFLYHRRCSWSVF